MHNNDAAARQDSLRIAVEGSQNPSLTAIGGGYGAFAPPMIGAREESKGAGCLSVEGAGRSGLVQRAIIQPASVSGFVSFEQPAFTQDLLECFRRVRGAENGAPGANGEILAFSCC
jgi:hypothetical protein